MVEAYFTEQHELIRKLAHDFAEKELTKEVLDQVEETEEFPEEILDKMAKAGFFGVKIPRELGGQGADARAYVLVMEEIARVSGVASIYVSSPNSLSGGPLLLAGNDSRCNRSQEAGLCPYGTRSRIRCRKRCNSSQKRGKSLCSERA